MLVLALGPDVWAAYSTEHAALYQLWQGEMLFEGSVYDYRHGPQPTSQGAFFYRAEAAADWQLELAGEQRQADVRYLGHRLSDDGASVALAFELSAGDWRATVIEQPELQALVDGRALQRRFTVSAEPAGLRVVGADLELAAGESERRLLMNAPTPIPVPAAPQTSGADGDIERGRQVVLNSDCVGCHNEVHTVVGPAYARIGRKYRGKLQANVIDALADSIIEGGVGTWGQVPMPAHPGLSRREARFAAMYILSTATLDAELDVPLAPDGSHYKATSQYSVGPRLDAVHPAFTLESVIPEGFQPKVGGLAFREDGSLLVVSWDGDGALFSVDTARGSVRRIAEGLHEPLGLAVVDDRIFVLQKQELTELIDRSGDGVIDEYRNHSNAWPTTSNFHSFAFGLDYFQGDFHALLSICVQPGGANCPQQLPSHGKLLRIGLADGAVETSCGSTGCYSG